MVHLEPRDLDALGRRGAIDAMRAFLVSAAAGTTASPPRLAVPAGPLTLVFTVGGDLRAGVGGVRVYSTGGHGLPAGRPDQLLALFDLGTGEVVATASGAEFGAWRTAAIGGVALEVALRGEGPPVTAAVLGAGFQAHHHARTWAATGLVARFRIFARRAPAAVEFAGALARDAGIPAEVSSTPDEALRGARAVLCATSSVVPLFPASALELDAYLATLGPKFGEAHEVPSEAFASAEAVFTDAPEQLRAYERARGRLGGTRPAQDVLSLADLVAGTSALPGRGLRLFASEGLAGTEAALLAATLDARREAGPA
jgi:alanine dehydrogenase